MRINRRGESKTSRYNRPKPKDIPIKEMELVATRRSSRLLKKNEDSQSSQVCRLMSYRIFKRSIHKLFKKS